MEHPRKEPTITDPSERKEPHQDGDNISHDTTRVAPSNLEIELCSTLFESHNSLFDALDRLILGQFLDYCPPSIKTELLTKNVRQSSFIRENHESGFLYEFDSLNDHSPGAQPIGILSTDEKIPVGLTRSKISEPLQVDSTSQSARIRIGFAPLKWGGFVLHKAYSSPSLKQEGFEVYSERGTLLSKADSLSYDLARLVEIPFEPNCPMITHLYCALVHEYSQASLGQANLKNVRLIETYLRELAERNPRVLSLPNFASSRIASLFQDNSYQTIRARIIEIESKSALSWSERRKVYLSLFSDADVLAKTKARAHRFSWFKYGPAFAADRLWLFIKRLTIKPRNNLGGLSYRYTIGLMLWFAHTIKSNIGYSVALALYGPFTFYFITQPLNPHAMWAVGKVRTAYIDTALVVTKTLGIASEIETTQTKPDQNGSAPATPKPTEKPMIEANAQAFATRTASHENFLISTDVPEVDRLDWNDRMSNFKAMQIGFEENLVFAARMGRMEQLETQLAFPMMAESAWGELSRYSDHLGRIKSSALYKKHEAALTPYIAKELERAKQTQLYIWDKLLKFLLDHPFVVMDQSREHSYTDFYTAKAFKIWLDMTQSLTVQYSDFKKPAQYKKIEKLALSLKKKKTTDFSVMSSLKENSKLFSLADRLDGNQIRGTMKRQWELLYLMQNKAQEASNFGLMVYTWSVRSTLWALQGIYSIKNRELGILFESTDLKAAASEINLNIEPIYESLFYLMNMDYASIEPEIGHRLNSDIEALQRRKVIESLEGFFNDRQAILTNTLGLKKDLAP